MNTPINTRFCRLTAQKISDVEAHYLAAQKAIQAGKKPVILPQDCQYIDVSDKWIDTQVGRAGDNQVDIKLDEHFGHRSTTIRLTTSQAWSLRCKIEETLT